MSSDLTPKNKTANNNSVSLASLHGTPEFFLYTKLG
jgi:hypothetical protein